MKKSQDFLTTCGSSQLHKETATYYHQKLNELSGIDVNPPTHLRLTEIASTIGAEAKMASTTNQPVLGETLK